jgi:hypothetical protein
VQHGVQAYQTALHSGGVQTHSVLTLGEEFIIGHNTLLIKCQVVSSEIILNSETLVLVPEDLPHRKFKSDVEKVKNIRSVDSEYSRDNTLVSNNPNKDGNEESSVSQSESTSVGINLQTMNVPSMPLYSKWLSLSSSCPRNDMKKYLLILMIALSIKF